MTFELFQSCFFFSSPKEASPREVVQDAEDDDARDECPAGLLLAPAAAAEQGRPADGDVAVGARDYRRVDAGRHGDLRQREQHRNSVREDVVLIVLAHRPRVEGRRMHAVSLKLYILYSRLVKIVEIVV